jgi:hypothetical protein
MKRLNPKTGKPFKRGDIRDDGYVFKTYAKTKNKNGFFIEGWVNLETYFFNETFNSAATRAKKNNLPFNLTKEYLKSIRTDNCPIFNTPLTWHRIGKGKKNNNNAPSLDRIIPEYGYIIGNVVYISKLANQIKSSATEVELYAVADWLHNERKRVLNNVEQIPVTPVPTRSHIQGAVGAELGSVSTPWTWENSDDTDNHSRAIQGQDVDHSAQASSPDSMGHGDKQMATPQQLNLLEDIG